MLTTSRYYEDVEPIIMQFGHLKKETASLIKDIRLGKHFLSLAMKEEKANRKRKAEEIEVNDLLEHHYQLVKRSRKEDRDKIENETNKPSLETQVLSFRSIVMNVEGNLIVLTVRRYLRGSPTERTTTLYNQCGNENLFCAICFFIYVMWK